MSNRVGSKLFISDDWKDDQPFVERLFDDLLSHLFLGMISGPILILAWFRNLQEAKT